MTSVMDKVLKYLQMETHIQEIMCMEKFKVADNMSGPQVKSTRDNLSKE